MVSLSLNTVVTRIARNARKAALSLQGVPIDSPDAAPGQLALRNVQPCKGCTFMREYEGGCPGDRR